MAPARRTRANPSPTGHRTLEDIPKPRRKPRGRARQPSPPPLADPSNDQENLQIAQSPSLMVERPPSPAIAPLASPLLEKLSPNVSIAKSDGSSLDSFKTANASLEVSQIRSTNTSPNISLNQSINTSLEASRIRSTNASPNVSLSQSTSSISQAVSSASSESRALSAADHRKPLQSALGKRRRSNSLTSANEFDGDMSLSEFYSRRGKRPRKSDLLAGLDEGNESDESIDMSNLPKPTVNIRSLLNNWRALHGGNARGAEPIDFNPSYTSFEELPRSEKNKLLTRNDVVEAEKALRDWVVRNPTLTLPSTECLHRLLDAAAQEEKSFMEANSSTASLRTPRLTLATASSAISAAKNILTRPLSFFASLSATATPTPTSFNDDNASIRRFPAPSPSRMVLAEVTKNSRAPSFSPPPISPALSSSPLSSPPNSSELENLSYLTSTKIPDSPTPAERRQPIHSRPITTLKTIQRRRRALRAKIMAEGNDRMETESTTSKTIQLRRQAFRAKVMAKRNGRMETESSSDEDSTSSSSIEYPDSDDEDAEDSLDLLDERARSRPADLRPTASHIATPRGLKSKIFNSGQFRVPSPSSSSEDSSSFDASSVFVNTPRRDSRSQGPCPATPARASLPDQAPGSILRTTNTEFAPKKSVTWVDQLTTPHFPDPNSRYVFFPSPDSVIPTDQSENLESPGLNTSIASVSTDLSPMDVDVSIESSTGSIASSVRSPRSPMDVDALSPPQSMASTNVERGSDPLSTNGSANLLAEGPESKEKFSHWLESKPDESAQAVESSDVVLIKPQLSEQEKYLLKRDTPRRPSNLRNEIINSPSSSSSSGVEEESDSDDGGCSFDPEVVAYVMSLPQESILPYSLPPYETGNDFDSNGLLNRDFEEPAWDPLISCLEKW